MLSLCKTRFFSGALRAQNHTSSRTLYDSKQDQIRFKDLGTKSQWILETIIQGGKVPLPCQSPRKDWNFIVKARTSHHHHWTKRKDQGIIIHYSMRRLDQNRRGRMKILLQFRLLEAYSYPKWSLGIQNPICFHWRGDKREVSRMDNYPLM